MSSYSTSYRPQAKELANTAIFPIGATPTLLDHRGVADDVADEAVAALHRTGVPAGGNVCAVKVARDLRLGCRRREQRRRRDARGVDEIHETCDTHSRQGSH
jgi:hypothetical protein